MKVAAAGHASMGQAELTVSRRIRTWLTSRQVAKLRDYAKAYVRDYPKRFEEARRIFFMIDQYPGNHERFDLVLKKVGDKLEISESSSTNGSSHVV